ncbi:MAG: hypothetical protein RLO21_06275 [Nitratireductor sp.]
MTSSDEGRPAEMAEVGKGDEILQFAQGHAPGVAGWRGGGEGRAWLWPAEPGVWQHAL